MNDHRDFFLTCFCKSICLSNWSKATVLEWCTLPIKAEWDIDVR